jgi:hypothetical protein
MADITEEDIKNALKRHSDFGYHGSNEEMFVTWSYGPVIQHRDSGLLEESNAAALKKALEEAAKEGIFSEDDYDITSANHWAVGWTEHLNFRAIESEESREPTAIFHWLTDWFASISDYPVADEEDYRERQFEYSMSALDDMLASKLRDDVPEDWKSHVFRGMDEPPNEDYWNEEDAIQVARLLGYLEDEEE